VSLARVLIQFTAPGTPDIYQGSELWNFTLVDPDNRRPVDFELRRRLLDEITRGDAPFDLRRHQAQLHESRAKLALIARLLKVRRDHASLFLEGDYTPIEAGAALFAFTRRWRDERCMTIARTRFAPAATGDMFATPASLPDELAGRWTSQLTARTVDLERGTNLEDAVREMLLPEGLCCELFLHADG
jgi:(1->4)-alpha-D-glucan 1-alpha-D-glucosylmutase